MIVQAHPETHGVELTEAAAAQVRDMLRAEGRDDLHLRIAAQPGGCSGLRYELFFDEVFRDVRDLHDVRVVVDPESAPLLAGARIDFLTSNGQEGFTIENPNARSGCGCRDGAEEPDAADATCGCGGGGSCSDEKEGSGGGCGCGGGSCG
jgi:iron-sulfur cluster assembly accessory protein